MTVRGGLVTAALLGLLVAGYRHYHSSPRAPQQRFLVPRKATAREIARHLHQEGLIWHPWTFLFWIKWSPRPGIRSGVYEISPSQSGRSILAQLRHGPPLMRVTFPEGWTSKQMAALLENRGITPAPEFLSVVEKDKREGFLYPDTYFFEQQTPASQIVEKLVHQFHEKEPKDILVQARAMHLTYLQVVSLASLVEKEARVPDERPIIAGVFYNRLRKHWRLESCATVQYALGAWKPQLTYKDLDVESPYNTYRHGGLPPGPICNPGTPALEAATHPAQTDKMFFVAEGGGTHRFTKYYDEHLAAQGVKVKHR